MRLSIQGARAASPREWDETWEGCEYATFFQSREWAELWERYSGRRLRPSPTLLEFSDGRRLVLPLTVRVGRFGLPHGWESSPGGTYGGWISTDALAREHVDRAVDWLVRECPDLVWRINPYFEPHGYVERLEARDDVTHVLDLADGYEAIEERWRKGGGAVARKIRKAARCGVRVREAVSERDWTEYVGCYESSLSRWGEAASMRYTPALFDILRRMSSARVRLWLARLGEAVVAGAICFYSRSHVVYWHGAARAEHFDKRPVNALMAEVIRGACEGGHRWFDFNPSGGHRGVAAFKASFGARTLACPVVVRHDSAHRALRLLRMAGRAVR